jgi:hypothetical protein
MPSLSFSLMPHHVDAIRDAAIKQQVSQSQVVREALDRYFPEYLPAAPEEEDVVVHRPPGSTVGLAQLIREIAGLRRELTDLRQTIAFHDWDAEEAAP